MKTLAYGIFGGSFDPPHYGHLALAEAARAQLGLTRVLFAPVGSPPHKAARVLSPVEDRVAMVQLALAEQPAFTLTRADVDRPGPHYTVEMLKLLAEQFPEARRWYFLMGEDTLCNFPAWYDPLGVLQQATLAVMPRHPRCADLDTLCTRLPLLAERLVWLDAPPIDCTATDLRRRAHAGLPLHGRLPPSVAAYIATHGLYVAAETPNGRSTPPLKDCTSLR